MYVVLQNEPKLRMRDIKLSSFVLVVKTKGRHDGKRENFSIGAALRCYRLNPSAMFPWTSGQELWLHQRAT